ncbi:hypothetical protein A3I46_00770 [Candidatus Kaiserbacteria bacterium RIFCSPLOWO2_02_FULL_54_13]|uniref:Methyltransferase domain-containing protein n=1 Tax=Candidatus Kaiserbacteria bacterium RIFCSPHIGHO2_02_FULL_54_22 TaxID=1798495 RepID=A0A1F6DJ84_9BACT|nr:MAG: hypothetical protein A3C19_01780 [Candidatus Kaiserbacteria bacterium RIFCSPHIGHO2_02_FULL_54_22]OGG68566.1 MAG: hypothetical protein A3E99_00295 [Candidatus Kaiserbacteria bacterium RIFCSPHIGHO2_12_FULL_54_16]OGG82856.1 MAG: hypothetical protein A3I46_00770 [Candidatus Kaiserbacteria bacterium RIFCSPLOWO2_02_FULL_54_13]
MAGTPFDYFGKNASELKNFAEIAGRYDFQRQAEQYLLYYLLEKLSLSPEDDLLEIGCGAGNLLIPLSFFVHSVTGIDHPNLLAQIKSRVPRDNDIMTLVPGEFPRVEVPGTFSRVLIYSVIQYLRDEEAVLTFIRTAAALLRPGGKMLIGDIPNKDIKDRFLATERGKAFSAEWKERVEQEKKKNPHIHQPMPAASLVTVDDALVEKIVAMLEGTHLRATRVRQPETLSFGYTREDIIVEK